MPIGRGERIGEAYVRVHADGERMPDEIRRQFDNLQPTLDEIADEQGARYSDRFADGYAREMTSARNKDLTNKALIGLLNETQGAMKGRGESMAGFLLSDLRKEFASQHGDRIGFQMGEILLQKIETGVLSRGGLARILGSPEAIRQLELQAVRMIDAFDKQLKISAEETRKENERLLETQAAKAREELSSITAEVKRLTDGHAAWGESTTDVRNRLRTLHTEMVRLNLLDNEVEKDIRRMRAEMILLSPRIERVNHSWRNMSDAIGRLTGRGSRNNFLNFIGSVNRNLSRLFGAITIGTARAISGFVRLTRSIPDFIADPKLFAEVAKNIGSFSANIFLNLSTMAIAFGIATAAASVFAAALSGLLAILSALGGTIAFGIAGSLGALAGTLAPISAGIAVVAGAFLTLSDAQKDALKNDVQPLIDGFTDLGKAAGDVLFRDVGKWARDIEPLIAKLEPTVVGVAEGIRNSLGRAVELATQKGSGLDRFIEAFEKFLPDAVESLGNITTNVLGGIGGVFRALIPLTRRFLGWLEDITEEFAGWANSRQGQRALKDFFKEAGDAAVVLGDFIEEVIELLAELFDQSESTGAEIFEDMTNAIEDLVGWLRSPEGRQAMEDWLQFGQDLAEAIGEVVTAVISLWDELDNPGNRSLVTFLVGGFARLLGVVENLVVFNERLRAKVASIVEAIQGFDFPNIGNLFLQPLRGADDFFEKVGDISTRLGRLTAPPNIWNLVQREGSRFVRFIGGELSKAINQIPHVVNLFTVPIRFARILIGLGEDLIRLIRRIPGVDNIFSTVIDKAGVFIGLVKDIPDLLDKINPIDNIFSTVIDNARVFINLVDSLIGKLSGIDVTINWPSIPDRFNKFIGGVGSPFEDARGGVFTKPRLSWTAEDGAEAIVPLDRPLHDVDPSVRWLSAIAQGLVPAGQNARPSITIPEVHWHTPTTDPAAASQELLNRLVGLTY